MMGVVTSKIYNTIAKVLNIDILSRTNKLLNDNIIWWHYSMESESIRSNYVEWLENSLSIKSSQ